MSNFFFIFQNKKSSGLVRVRVKGSVLPKYEESYMTNFLEEIKEQYLDDALSKTSSQIASGYRKKLNSSKIFFKNQFSYIHQSVANSEKYTHFDLEEFTSLLGQIDFLFDERTYGNKTNEELDVFKVVVEPDKLLTILDASIDSATNLNKKIIDNYDLFVARDKELLEKKNTLLQSKNPNCFKDIFETIKEREKLSYLLLDIDVDVTNSLIELFNLKYLKLRDDDLLLTLESIKNNVKTVRQLLIIFKEYENKYLS